MVNDVKRVINLNNVVNARDLGGLVTADGRKIKKGLLIRCGQLFEADEHDIDILKGYNIATIVDFRGKRERTSKPDASVGEKQNVHLPVIRERNAAIERIDDDKNKEEQKKSKTGDFFMDMELENPGSCLNFLTRSYRDFITDEYQVSVYHDFVKLVLDTTEGAVLWHCAGGKDRAGFGAIVLEALLGVPKERILEDYLMTNFYNQKDIEGMKYKIAHAELPEGTDRELFAKSMISVCDASEEIFNQIFKAADEIYGGYENYLREAMKITDEEIAILKDRYLE